MAKPENDLSAAPRLEAETTKKVDAADVEAALSHDELDEEARRLNAAAARELLDSPDVESKVINRRGQPRRVVTLKGAAATKDILVLAEYPFATLGDGRGKPTAMQKANRFEYEWDVTDPVTGKKVRALWRVVGDDELGLPTAQDEELYLVLMQISREQGFPLRVRFTVYDLLKRLGWSDDKQRYEDINLGLQRLLGVRIYAENILRPTPGHPNAGDLGATGFPLLGGFYLKNETQTRSRKAAPPHPSEKEAQEPEDASQEQMQAKVPASHFSWSPPLQTLLSEGQMRSLNLDFLLSLKLPISKRLARYLGKKAGDGKTSFEIGLSLLCSRHLNMTAVAYESVMKQRLKGAHDELLDRDFLTRVTYGAMKTRVGAKVLYEFGPKAFEIESTLPDALSPSAPAPLPGPLQPTLPLEGPLSAANETSEGDTAEGELEAEQDPLAAPQTASKEKAAARKSERALLKCIEAVGVSASVARELLGEFGAIQLQLQLNCLADREPRDAAATWVKAVRETWAPPGAYLDRLEAQEREAARRAAQEREQERQAQHRATETRERETQQRENEQLDLLWSKLDPSTRERLEREAVERLGILGRLGKAQSALLAMRRAVLRERLGQLEGEEND